MRMLTDAIPDAPKFNLLRYSVLEDLSQGIRKGKSRHWMAVFKGQLGRCREKSTAKEALKSSQNQLRSI